MKLSFLIGITMALVNLPFALQGHWLNTVAFGFCLGMATAAFINDAIDWYSERRHL